MRGDLAFVIALSATGCTLLIPFDERPDAGAPTATKPDASVDEVPSEAAAPPCFSDPFPNRRFAPPQGFPANWSYDGATYKQTKSRNGVDVSVLGESESVSEVEVKVDVESSSPNSDTPKRQQNLIVVGATMTNGVFKGIGCGVELLSGTSMNELTSVVRVEGPPDAVVTTPLDVVKREQIKIDETFTMTAKLQGGTLTCTALIRNVPSVASASNLGIAAGSIALYTRQNVALFENISVCRL
jgi:hypothetical protein